MLQLLAGLMELLTQAIRLLARTGELLDGALVLQGRHQSIEGACPAQPLQIIAVGSGPPQVGGQFQVEVGIEHGRRFAQQGQGHQGTQRIGRAQGRPAFRWGRRHRPLRQIGPGRGEEALQALHMTQVPGAGQLQQPPVALQNGRGSAECAMGRGIQKQQGSVALLLRSLRGIPGDASDGQQLLDHRGRQGKGAVPAKHHQAARAILHSANAWARAPWSWVAKLAGSTR